MCTRYTLGIVVGCVVLIPLVLCQTYSYFDRQCPLDKTNALRKCKFYIDRTFDFTQFRQWTSHLKHVKTSLELSCSPNGRIFLPWPMKAKGLIKLNVKGCAIEGFFTEFNITHADILDELQESTLESCVIMADINSIFDVIYKPVSKEYDCGQQTVDSVVRRNISYSFPNLKQKRLSKKQEDMLLSSADILINKAKRKPYICRYSNLKYIDQSIARSRSKLHLRFMTAYSEYPKLQTILISDNGYRRIPQVLVDWKNSFPQLSYLDMSHNNVRKFNFLGTSYGNKVLRKRPLVVNLSYNSVKSVPLNIGNYITWSVPIIIDLTGNPLRCGCSFLRYKNYVMRVIRRFRRFKQLSDIKCYSTNSNRQIRLAEYETTNCLVRGI